MEVSQCPLWVKSSHVQSKKPCPLCPRKRTCAAHKLMSALGRKRTMHRSMIFKTIDHRICSPMILKMTNEATHLHATPIDIPIRVSTRRSSGCSHASCGLFAAIQRACGHPAKLWDRPVPKVSLVRTRVNRIAERPTSLNLIRLVRDKAAIGIIY